MWAVGIGNGGICWDVHRVRMLCSAMYREDDVEPFGVLLCKLGRQTNVSCVL